MKYIKLSTLEYPRYEGDIRIEHSEITEDQTYPNFPIPNTYALVNVPETPNYNPDTQAIVESVPSQVNGVWSVELSVRDLTTDELAEMKAQKDAFDKIRKNALPLPLKKSGSIPNAI